MPPTVTVPSYVVGGPMTGPTAPVSSVGSPKMLPMRVFDGLISQVSLPEKRLLEVSRSVTVPASGPVVIWRWFVLSTWSYAPKNQSRSFRM